jgi:hypothetical protein
VKRFCSSSKVAVFLLLNVLCWMNVAHGQLAVNPASVSFGSVQAGTATAQSLVLSNSSKSDLTVSQAIVAGQGFSLRGPSLPLTLTSGQNVVVNVVFAPVSGGSTTGSVSLVSSATSTHDRSGKHNSVRTATTTVVLSGSGFVPPTTVVTPGVLVAYPSSMGFPSLQVGSSQTLLATLTNSGGAAVTISQATIIQATNVNAFSLNGLSLPATLAAGQSVIFSVAFTPLSAGSASGSISINSDASNPTLNIALAGTGAAQGQLAVTPVSADFGSVTVGTSKTQSATLVASGSSVTVSSASVTDTEFSLSGIAFPVTIPAGQSLPLTLTFVPRASGTAAATLAFSSNATNSAAENLAGTGVAPPQHSVDLSWDPVSAVVGYNVYRGSQSGGPYSKINPVLDGSTTFSDTTVQSGQNYYYVTTSVDSIGAQSSYSNETHAVIPTP